MAKSRRSLQTPGLSSRVYVPIILDIFHAKHTKGAKRVAFTLDDIRDSARRLKITVRNPADVVYRMRARTRLPEEILRLGFHIMRQTGRGRYRLELAASTIIPVPEGPVTDAIDTTPLPVRRLLPEVLAEIDEQGLLSIVNYCQILDHFTGLKVYRLRSHVRKSVVGVGQAEVDEVDVGVAMGEDEIPVVFPIEAKAADEAVNRVQIASQVTFAKQYFPSHQIRPISIKVDYDSVVHFLEFNVTTEPSEVEVVRSARYRIGLSERQLTAIRSSTVRKL